MSSPTDTSSSLFEVPAFPADPVVFSLVRFEDATGVSGTGVVAWGTVYPNGKVSLAWRGDRSSINVYDSVDDVRAVHGHGGATVLVPDARRRGRPRQAVEVRGS